MQKPKTFLWIGAFFALLSSCSISPNLPPESSSEGSSGTSSASLDSSSDLSSSEQETYHFYCINDFHGSVLEQTQSYYEVGLEKMMGELKALKGKDPDHTFVFSDGDMWQGSYESNSNYGNLVTKAMNESFDAMVLGNHEFDYGVDKIFANQALADFPILAGNIMKWDDGETDQSWGKTDCSTIIERGGMKLGVVGMIGEGQTTSITSKNVSDLIFVSPEFLAEEEAMRLRTEEGCNAVILLLHADASAIVSGWENASTIGTYFDGIFTGHSHSKNNEYLDETPIVQSYCNGEAISHFDITLSGNQVSSSAGEIISASPDWPKSDYAVSLCDEYIRSDSFLSRSNAHAGTISGSFSSKTVSEFACKAIYEKYSGEYDLACAMQNSQRSSVKSGEVLYSNLYKAMPFTNNIVIMTVSGEELLAEGRYNCTYTADTSRYGKESISSNETYTIAVIDYIAYHQNISKKYDYFKGLNTGADQILAEYETYPVDIAFDYMSSLSGTINVSQYTGSENGYSIYK